MQMRGKFATPISPTGLGGLTGPQKAGRKFPGPKQVGRGKQMPLPQSSQPAKSCNCRLILLTSPHLQRMKLGPLYEERYARQ